MTMPRDPAGPSADAPRRTSRARRGVADAAVLASYVLVAALFGVLSLESELRTPLWSVLALFLGGVLAALLHRRGDVAALAAALVLLPLTAALGTTAEALLVVPALYRIALHRSARQAWTAVGAAAAVTALGTLLLAFRLQHGPPLLGLAPRDVSSSWQTEWASLGVIAFVALFVTPLLGINRGHRRRHIAALEERAEQMRRERDQQASIAAALERERIAREMHDVIAHSLSVMIALADGAEATAEARPAESRRAIGRVAETGRRTLGEVRRLLGTVRGEEGEAQSSRPAALGLAQLPDLVEEFREAGLPVTLELRGGLEPGSVVGMTIYRIVQESLTNVLRHARGVRAVLVRVLLDDEVTILVEDTSEPAAPATDPGRGLVGIRERAAFYDGRVTAGPRPGGGWQVAVRLSADAQ